MVRNPSTGATIVVRPVEAGDLDALERLADLPHRRATAALATDHLMARTMPAPRPFMVILRFVTQRPPTRPLWTR